MAPAGRSRVGAPEALGAAPLIYFLMTRKFHHPINRFLGTMGARLGKRLWPIDYEELFHWRALPVGSYIFADLERLSDADLERAAMVWNTLAGSGHDLRLLNHPLRAMRRYELLRTLHARGINDFDVYRLTEPRRPQRFPVFIRVENDHEGSETRLLETPAQLEAAIEQLIAEGKCRDSRIITEFNAAPGDRGLYRKYGAFFLGGTVYPRNVQFSRQWMVKMPDVVDDATMAEELRYIETNPDEAALREIFEIARIDYGRIDYGKVDGRIQVYEINTNPLFSQSLAGQRARVDGPFAECAAAAFEAFDHPAAPRPTIPVRLAPAPREPLLVRAWGVARRLMRGAGLSAYEPFAYLWLKERWRRALKPADRPADYDPRARYRAVAQAGTGNEAGGLQPPARAADR